MDPILIGILQIVKQPLPERVNNIKADKGWGEGEKRKHHSFLD